jgi:hypothetical protein
MIHPFVRKMGIYREWFPKIFSQAVSYAHSLHGTREEVSHGKEDEKNCSDF